MRTIIAANCNFQGSSTYFKKHYKMGGQYALIVLIILVALDYSSRFAAGSLSVVWSFEINDRYYSGNIRKCHFPFEYDGEEYNNSCASYGVDLLWCAYDWNWNSDESWGECILPNKQPINQTECPVAGGINGMEYGKKCYTWYNNDNDKSWIHAQDECNKFGGNLAVANTQTLTDELAIKQWSIFDNKLTWIGGFEVSNVQWWINGETTITAVNSSWAGSQPSHDDHHCLTLKKNGKNNLWNDKDCFNPGNNHVGFICEFEMEQFAIRVDTSISSLTTTLHHEPVTTNNFGARNKLTDKANAIDITGLATGVAVGVIISVVIAIAIFILFRRGKFSTCINTHRRRSFESEVSPTSVSVSAIMSNSVYTLDDGTTCDIGLRNGKIAHGYNGLNDADKNMKVDKSQNRDYETLHNTEDAEYSYAAFGGSVMENKNKIDLEEDPQYCELETESSNIQTDYLGDKFSEPGNISENKVNVKIDADRDQSSSDNGFHGNVDAAAMIDNDIYESGSNNEDGLEMIDNEIYKMT